MPVASARAIGAIGADRIVNQNARLAAGKRIVGTAKDSVKPAPIQRGAEDVVTHHRRADARTEKAANLVTCIDQIPGTPDRRNVVRCQGTR
jgi:hypothetical protein